MIAVAKPYQSQARRDVGWSAFKLEPQISKLFRIVVNRAADTGMCAAGNQHSVTHKQWVCAAGNQHSIT